MAEPQHGEYWWITPLITPPEADPSYAKDEKYVAQICVVGNKSTHVYFNGNIVHVNHIKFIQKVEEPTNDQN